MKTKLFKRRLFSKVIVFMIIANFIFMGNVFASDSLRATAAKEARDGGTFPRALIRVKLMLGIYEE